VSCTLCHQIGDAGLGTIDIMQAWQLGHR
jgi:hypothetical protein